MLSLSYPRLERVPDPSESEKMQTDEDEREGDEW
eukprot:gene6598-7102_t